MRRSRRTALTLLVCVSLPCVLLAMPAGAKWRIHNGNDVSDMTAPPGGTVNQTCSDQLRGATGWSTFALDPSELDPVPASALTSANYQVFKAPPGFTDFSQGNAVFDDNGDIIGYDFDGTPATNVVNFTTIPRTALVTPIPLNLDPDPGDVFVVSAAQINQQLPGVSPGDVLGVKPTGASSILTIKAIDCDDTGDYQVGEFSGPVDDPPIVNLGDAGNSYTVRFRLSNVLGSTISAKKAIAGVTEAPTDCQSLSGRPTDTIETSTTGSSRLRFVAAKDQFVYRWQTPTDTGCYKLKFIYDSGQHKQALFNLS